VIPSVTTAPPLFSTDVHETVVAGSPNSALPGGSTDPNIDPNTLTSPFAGVGSLLVTTKTASYIGTATVIGRREILTAAHVVDLNNDGRVDRRDGITGVYFILNVGENESSRIAVAKFDIDPDFTGFNHPAVNDDLAVLTLAEDVPQDVPIYSLPSNDLAAGTVVTMVGYGRAGDGVKGYTSDASLTVKRSGENVVDAFYGQDDKGSPAENEVYRFDFDGPTGNGPLGGPTLGADREMQLGTGDSGGPLFVSAGGKYVLAGVNTYVQGSNAPKFGSMGGGVNLYAYLDFIRSVVGEDGISTISTITNEPPTTTSNPLPVSTVGAPLLPAHVVLPPMPKPGIGIGAKPVSGVLGFVADTSTSPATGPAGVSSDVSFNGFVSGPDNTTAVALVNASPDSGAKLIDNDAFIPSPFFVAGLPISVDSGLLLSAGNSETGLSIDS
jgi:Trypsin